MSDYKQDGNRWTAVFLVEREKGDILTYRRLPFELVRFNVDTHPSAPQEIVPNGIDAFNGAGDKQSSDKIYEKIWIVDSIPFGAKTTFGRPE